MQRIINDPYLVVEDMLKGFAKCHKHLVAPIDENPRVLKYVRRRSKAFKAANGGADIAGLYGNYAGDNMNVKMARQLAAMEGIEVKTVVANDDVASAPKTEPQKRRGVAGEVLMWKVGGAKSTQGGSLDEVIRCGAESHRQHTEHRGRANFMHYSCCSKA
jgi:phosphoenolpyruvate---glycerone phosphotransferase subunit DhaK